MVRIGAGVQLHRRSARSAIHDPEEREFLPIDERRRPFRMKVSPADLDRERVCGGVGGLVLMAAARDGRDEDEQQPELST
jgi:hypothetical protein